MKGASLPIVGVAKKASRMAELPELPPAPQLTFDLNVDDQASERDVAVVVPRLRSKPTQRRQIRYPSRKGGSHGCSFIKNCLYLPEAVDHG
jgi:hypothetical protein